MEPCPNQWKRHAYVILSFHVIPLSSKNDVNYLQICLIYAIYLFYLTRRKAPACQDFGTRSRRYWPAHVHAQRFPVPQPLSVPQIPQFLFLSVTGIAPLNYSNSKVPRFTSTVILFRLWIYPAQIWLPVGVRELALSACPESWTGQRLWVLLLTKSVAVSRKEIEWAQQNPCRKHLWLGF